MSSLTGSDPVPRAPMERARPLGWLVNLNAAWFGLAYLWNGLHAILLPVLLAGLVPLGLKNTYLGALTFVGLALAMVVQPIAGALSDQSGWLGRFGKRRPWMAAGTALDVLLLALLARQQSFVPLACAYAGMQIASSFVEATLQGLLPDLVPPGKRGRAAGFKNAAQIAGFVAGVGLGGFLAGRGQTQMALAVAAAILVVTVVWTIFGVREQPVTRSRMLVRPSAVAEVVLDSFRFDNRAAPGYARLLAGRALVMAGFFALQSFAQYFVADSLAAPDPAGITALLMAVMGAAVLVLAVPVGTLADRVGRRGLNVAAGLLGTLATMSLVLVGNLVQLMIAGGLIGAAVGIFLSVNWAWAADLVPQDEAGRYLGLSNLATAGASAFSRLFAGPIVDAGNHWQVGLGYDALFFVLGLGMLAGTAILAGVPETRLAGAQPLPEPVHVEPAE